MHNFSPLVTAVIPTRNRPDLVSRAVHSALNQTFTYLEVIVVVDGPDPQTVKVLEQIGDRRLRIIALEESVGGAEARNVGARAARGKWIALLDDDDEWLPEKTGAQIEVAERIGTSQVFVGSRFIERSQAGERILPSRPVITEQPVSETLFYRERIRGGTGYVQTSTWFISKDLLLRVPFTKGLKRNQDADWMLHALTLPDVSFAIVEQPLAVFHDDDCPSRVSKKADWRFHYEWALLNRKYFTRKALAFFFLTTCVQDSVTERQTTRAGLFLLRESFRLGSPTLLSLGFFLYYCLLPDRYRRVVRGRNREVTVCE